MTKGKAPSRRVAYGLIAIVVVVGVIVVAASFKFMEDKPNHTLALADKAVARDKTELCSPYANLCFTRPTNWTRSKILHVNGSADNTIEINPPTGTILEFAKSSDDTITHCNKAAYKECIIKVSKIDTLQNGLSVVTGMLIGSPDANCRDDCVSPQYTPFVQLVSMEDLQKYQFKNDTSSFEDYNPAARVKNGQAVYFQVTPGKGYGVDKAGQWLDSSEAKTAQQILSSVTLYQ